MGKWPYWKYFSKDFFDHPPSLVIFASFLSDFSSFLSDMSSREGRKAFSRKFMESFSPKKYWILLHIAFQFPIWCRKEDFFLFYQLQIDDKWQLTILKSLLNSDVSNTILLNIEGTRISIKLEHVHLLVIELEHPIFGFERTKIEH